MLHFCLAVDVTKASAVGVEVSRQIKVSRTSGSIAFHIVDQRSVNVPVRPTTCGYIPNVFARLSAVSRRFSRTGQLPNLIDFLD